MEFKILIVLSVAIYCNCSVGQTNLMFESGFEFVARLNDTGITFVGEYPSGNYSTCTNTATSFQDCNFGRDASPLTNSPLDGHAGFSFTKMDASGIPLVDQSLDYASNPWFCTKDNVTGLYWEVKTNTTGIHYLNNTYQWGGQTAIGRVHPNRIGTYYYPSWNELVQGSNTQNLCGFNDWRLPTAFELLSIVNKGELGFYINVDFFPNISPNWFWSSSPYANEENSAWIIKLYGGYMIGSLRWGENHVLLVRSR